MFCHGKLILITGILRNLFRDRRVIQLVEGLSCKFEDLRLRSRTNKNNAAAAGGGSGAGAAGGCGSDDADGGGGCDGFGDGGDGFGDGDATSQAWLYTDWKGRDKWISRIH